MRMCLAAILPLILTGCGTEPQASDSVAIPALKRPIERLAVAHAGEDVPAMRASARDVIATYDQLSGAR